MRMKLKLPRFLRRKKVEAVAEAEKPEVKVEREFPNITDAELKKRVGKHVALVEGEIAASAGTAGVALKMARRKHSGKQIVLRYVASERLLIPCRCTGNRNIKKVSSGEQITTARSGM
jgi:hypothetical protein